jgi:ribosome biogenesis GTPase A
MLSPGNRSSRHCSVSRLCRETKRITLTLRRPRFRVKVTAPVPDLPTGESPAVERLLPEVLQREAMIQWYPGHMAKTRRALAKAFPTQDLILEVLDARMPYASSNPVITTLRKQKPCIKILSKADLADPEVTAEWLRYLTLPQTQIPDVANGRVVAIASSSNHFAATKQGIIELCRRLTGRSGDRLRPIKAMVVGIPNVGKSTIINLLLGRKVAKVRDEPAVTKSQQQVELECGIVLSDNPGLLWPNISDAATGLHLALGGSFSEAALDCESVARYGAEVLLARYPKLVMARYKLAMPAEDGDALLREIGKRRGCLRKDGDIDLHKAADVLIHDFRQGAIGRVSLEEPHYWASDRTDL